MTLLSGTQHGRLGAAVCGAILVLTLLSISPPAHAQTKDCAVAEAPNGKPFGKRFGRLLGRAGVAALTGRKAAAQAAADAAARDTIDSARENAVAAASNAACTDADHASEKTEPREPARKRANPLSRPDQIAVPAEIKAQKTAFDEFGKVACSSCEGGVSYDSWARQFYLSELRGDENGWEKKLAALQPGEQISWQGSESFGTIVLRGEQQRDGFDCKLFDWRLEKGSATAQREGLLCWGKSSEYSGSNSWVEVY